MLNDVMMMFVKKLSDDVELIIVSPRRGEG